MKKTILIYLLLSHVGLAQEPTLLNPRKVAIGFTPQYLFVNGLRVEIEIPTNATSAWLVNPIYYLSDGTNNTPQSYGRDAVEGFGAEIMRKSYLWQKEFPKKYTHKRFYVGYGTGYHRLKVSYDEISWTRDGIFYYPQNRRFHENVHRLDVFGVVGFRYEWYDKLFADASIGPCIKRAFFKKEQDIYLRQYTNTIDYHYSGMALRFLISVGMRF